MLFTNCFGAASAAVVAAVVALIVTTSAPVVAGEILHDGLPLLLPFTLALG